VSQPVDPSPQDVAGGHAVETRRRASPPALEADTPRLVLVGIAAWLVALVVGLVFFRDDPDWLWTCAAGAVLGLLGFVLARRARR
jgi:hypothetical protein